MSETNPPVDEPPGKDGYQGVNNPDAVPPPPEWPPGANPPGTHPPVDPPVDPATVPVPGSVPTFNQGMEPAPETPPPVGPPENVDVPHVSQAGDTLSCTMGNWTNEPTTYSYVWKLDDQVAGADSSTLTVTAADIDRIAHCVVTASNAAGATEAPPSNEVMVTDPAG